MEEELLLVDDRTLLPAPVADDILVGRAGAPGVDLEHEVKREQIEVVSPPRRTVDELLATIVDGRRAADTAASAVGARAVALGTATLPCQPHAVASARYELMRERFGVTMQEQLTCGFHVHVGIDSAEEGVAILDRIRPWLPVLLALSANSPFSQGLDTHFASFRYQAWGRWPTAGPYDAFGTVAGYRAAIEQVIAAEVSLDHGMVYFDARLSHHVPTVEVRVADVCLRPRDAAVLAVLVRALVNTAALGWAAGVAPADVSSASLRLASWRASRYGISGQLLDPLDGRLSNADLVVRALLDHVDRGFVDGAERGLVRANIEDIVRRGNGAVAQRRAMAGRGVCEDVVAEAIRLTHENAVSAQLLPRQ